jgi:hypothetical protein
MEGGEWSETEGERQRGIVREEGQKRRDKRGETEVKRQWEHKHEYENEK